ncbi:histidine kinase/DNA gyrase B/HSP90-like ATPase [Chitinophaga niastensis]|uniref:Histidine kinase/DNA gyrase B/HSP90-like ATPase n=1 Tax=Chitinophaga niastensis TaxID=536980 RepID=A0A2P8HTH6_CHINA|nr:ATP-binding protein [Chitinophaga niastensis]PSL49502.1 histidine kinase/DNA gyrase B/HSP90-like ATPase [Chitinophaga niastensis]
MPDHVELIPSPALFIKSIAEQGYTLSTALADLIDNSITAGATRVEILFNKKSLPHQLLIADNGGGMASDQLVANMRFPSNDLELEREGDDLGRFGLGLKTASFSQAKKFAVISRMKGTEKFSGRTWDLDYLKDNGWALIINTDDEVQGFIDQYFSDNKNYHNLDPSFSPNTLITWSNLFKLRKANEQELEDELNEVRNHLSLIFHRYLDSRKLIIRLNNEIISGFNPFPLNQSDIQKVNEKHWWSGTDYIDFQGIILPKKAIEESKRGSSIWTPPGKSLFDMEGLFVYRNDRLIHYGSWLRTRKKSNLLRLGRVRIDIKNDTDALFQLNVAKSFLKLPFELKKAMVEMIGVVEAQSIKEYKEKVTGEMVLKNIGYPSDLQLINKVITGAGPKLRINESFLLVRQLLESIGAADKNKLLILLQLIEGKLNEVWEADSSGSVVEENDFSQEEKEKILNLRHYYIDGGLSKQEVEKWLLDNISQSAAQQAYIKSLT